IEGKDADTATLGQSLSITNLADYIVPEMYRNAPETLIKVLDIFDQNAASRGVDLSSVKPVKKDGKVGFAAANDNKATKEFVKVLNENFKGISMDDASAILVAGAVPAYTAIKMVTLEAEKNQFELMPVSDLYKAGFMIETPEVADYIYSVAPKSEYKPESNEIKERLQGVFGKELKPEQKEQLEQAVDHNKLLEESLMYLKWHNPELLKSGIESFQKLYDAETLAKLTPYDAETLLNELVTAADVKAIEPMVKAAEKSENTIVAPVFMPEKYRAQTEKSIAGAREYYKNLGFDVQFVPLMKDLTPVVAKYAKFLSTHNNKKDFYPMEIITEKLLEPLTAKFGTPVVAFIDLPLYGASESHTDTIGQGSAFTSAMIGYNPFTAGKFGTYNRAPTALTRSLKKAVLHEFGHTLGLGHSADNVPSVMQRSKGEPLNLKDSLNKNAIMSKLVNLPYFRKDDAKNTGERLFKTSFKLHFLRKPSTYTPGEVVTIGNNLRAFKGMQNQYSQIMNMQALAGNSGVQAAAKFAQEPVMKTIQAMARNLNGDDISKGMPISKIVDYLNTRNGNKFSAAYLNTERFTGADSNYDAAARFVLGNNGNGNGDGIAPLIAGHKGNNGDGSTVQYIADTDTLRNFISNNGKEPVIVVVDQKTMESHPEMFKAMTADEQKTLLVKDAMSEVRAEAKESESRQSAGGNNGGANSNDGGTSSATVPMPVSTIPQMPMMPPMMHTAFGLAGFVIDRRRMLALINALRRAAGRAEIKEADAEKESTVNGQSSTAVPVDRGLPIIESTSTMAQAGANASNSDSASITENKKLDMSSSERALLGFVFFMAAIAAALQMTTGPPTAGENILSSAVSFNAGHIFSLAFAPIFITINNSSIQKIKGFISTGIRTIIPGFVSVLLNLPWLVVGGNSETAGVFVSVNDMGAMASPLQGLTPISARVAQSANFPGSASNRPNLPWLVVGMIFEAAGDLISVLNTKISDFINNLKAMSDTLKAEFAGKAGVMTAPPAVLTLIITGFALAIQGRRLPWLKSISKNWNLNTLSSITRTQQYLSRPATATTGISDYSLSAKTPETRIAATAARTAGKNFRAQTERLLSAGSALPGEVISRFTRLMDHVTKLSATVQFGTRRSSWTTPSPQGLTPVLRTPSLTLLALVPFMMNVAQAAEGTGNPVKTFAVNHPGTVIIVGIGLLFVIGIVFDYYWLVWKLNYPYSYLLRRDAAKSLGTLGDKRAIGPLFERLEDEDESVRMAVRDALVKLGVSKEKLDEKVRIAVEPDQKRRVIAEADEKRGIAVEPDQKRMTMYVNNHCCPSSNYSLPKYARYFSRETEKIFTTVPVKKPFQMEENDFTISEEPIQFSEEPIQFSEEPIQFPEERFNACLQGHTRKITSLAVLNKQIISGSLDKTIRVWDLESSKVKILRSPEPVDVLAILNNKIVSGDSHGTIRVWDLESSKVKILRSPVPGAIDALAILNNKIVSGGSSRIIYIWDLESSKVKILRG
ncbi:MAG: HEAT repeat domain-containing protein, partial [Candidatus Omnitrophica bacterium]|nr:HEAT repeat domain-containing protein [Candidatus Omnitrophota bacterium]